ncbi:SEC-C metal-binding domain-containing protein [Kingella kingae]|uniref:SEC-C metal-binding domain-containing protein n=1 Tax=Kingella kingae TaxID=504 RepID=UPI0004065AEC|nr:SEC-C metal-binding domain-containing protein [Kingella kingae]MDK4554589.1 SEC-C metal-binding domain-containing protein [Kingella kingae]MDK4576127.1 SEC-C metal-binding domain-containing protein [Kingella kingae]MDK4582118.1 SEC-C metal-binding domain-containing protein [Kingella kingae]MDK4583678.1 SEC-C metal-binding domain-containing protein [Kingella kingae]MDK4587594.1 SEC-C metal-binding domain-containing protein [Kingella kingae]
MQTEQEIFNELSELCSQKGFIHALVEIWFEDNFYQANKNGNFTISKISHFQSDRSKLNRNELNTLLALLVKSNPNFAQDEKPDTEILETYKAKAYQLLEEFHEILAQSSFQTMLEKVIPFYQDKLPPSFSELSENEAFLQPDTMREAIFYSGDGVYDFQYQDLGCEKYINDNQWFIDNKNFSIEWAHFFLEIIFSLQHKKVNETSSVSIDSFIYSREDILKFISERFGQKAVDFFPIDSMVSFIKSFSLNSVLLEKLNEFQNFDDFNPITAFPFIKLAEDKFLLLDIYTLSQAFYETPFFWLNNDDKYRNIASDNRGEFTENWTYQICCDIFGESNVWKNIDLYSQSSPTQSKKDKLGEVDILVNINGFALIFQAKSKKLTLESRKGNIPQIKGDFFKAIQHAYNQAFECSEILLENNYIAKIDDKVVKLPEINYCVPICVLSEHFPALTAQIRWLLEEKQHMHIAPALVFDVFLLHLMHLTLSTPLDFLHFIHSLSKSRKYFLAQTQIDLLSMHLNRNFLCSSDADMFMLDNGLSAELELFLLKIRGRMITKDKEIEIPSCWLKFKNTYWWQLFIFNSSLDTVDKLKFGLELLQCSGEFIEDYNSIVNDRISSLALSSNKHLSDFTILLSSSIGITVYVSNLPFITGELIQKIHRHAFLRKYSFKSDLWFGLIISITGEVKYLKAFDDKWEFNERIDRECQKSFSKNSKIKRFINGKVVTQKIGRNDPCPCGSGRKYKRCCLNNK